LGAVDEALAAAEVEGLVVVVEQGTDEGVATQAAGVGRAGPALR
jgi:hypothetical protein